MRNSDSAKGKSGGYRVIYHVKEPGSVILVTIYSKSEQADVSPAELRRIIEECEPEEAPGEEGATEESGDGP